MATILYEYRILHRSTDGYDLAQARKVEHGFWSVTRHPWRAIGPWRRWIENAQKDIDQHMITGE